MTDTPAYSSLSADEVVAVLCERERYLVLFHVHPDGDSVGSAFALANMIKATGREAYCVCADEVPERLCFASEDLQESVLVSSIPEDYTPDAIISVDTAAPSQLGELYDVYKDKIDLMIDHHGKGTYYADYYIWTSGKGVKPPKPNPKDRGDWVDNQYPRDGYYLMNYYDIQPALNYGFHQPDPSRPWEQSYDAPGPRAVRQEIKNILSFWFDKGVDGFRCDLAWSLVKGDDKDFNGVRRLWKEIFDWQQANYPETIFLSEWSSPVEAISCGFDIDIIRHNGCGKTMYRDLVYNTERNADPVTGKYPPKDCWFDKAGNGRFDTFAVPFEEMYRTTKGHGFPCMPICSHDTWRINRNQRSSVDELKTAMAFFLTMPWVPIVYYGEEIGMRSMDGAPMIEGSRDRSAERTPMQWGPGQTAGFSTCDPSQLYLPVDTSLGRPEVEAQINDPESMLSWTKGLLELRSKTPALGNTGDWKMVSDPYKPYPVVYERFSTDQRYLVVLNPREKQAEVKVGEYGALEVVWGDASDLKVTSRGGTMTLKIKGKASVICRIINN